MLSTFPNFDLNKTTKCDACEDINPESNLKHLQCEYLANKTKEIMNKLKKDC